MYRPLAIKLKFHLNLLTQTIVTAAFVRSPQSTLVSDSVAEVIPKDLKLKCLGVTSLKPL